LRTKTQRLFVHFISPGHELVHGKMHMPLNPFCTRSPREQTGLTLWSAAGGHSSSALQSGLPTQVVAEPALGPMLTEARPQSQP
jgi:hypothetical protein